MRVVYKKKNGRNAKRTNDVKLNVLQGNDEQQKQQQKWRKKKDTSGKLVMKVDRMDPFRKSNPHECPPP